MGNSTASKIDTDTPFGVVPQFAFEETGVSVAALGLYAYLTTFADPEGFCWPAVPRLASALKVTDRTVQNWRKELQLSGLIIVTRRQGQSSMIRVIRRRGETLKLKMTNEPSAAQSKGVKRTSPLTKSRAPEGVKQSSPKHNNPNNTKIQDRDTAENDYGNCENGLLVKEGIQTHRKPSQVVRVTVVKKLGGGEKGWALAMELEKYRLFGELIELEQLGKLTQADIQQALSSLYLRLEQ